MVKLVADKIAGVVKAANQIEIPVSAFLQECAAVPGPWCFVNIGSIERIIHSISQSFNLEWRKRTPHVFT